MDQPQQSSPSSEVATSASVPFIHPILQRPLRAYRWVVSFVVLGLVGNVLLLFFSNGISGFLPAARAQVAALLALIVAHPVVSILLLGLLAGLFLAALRAEREYRAQLLAQEVSERREAVTSAAEEAIHEVLEERTDIVAASARPLGPPDDLALLQAPARFIGRQADLAWVLDQLRHGSTSAIVAVRGLGGIGKTTLAAMAARQLKAEGCFPDGIAVVLCQGVREPALILQFVLTRFDPYRRAPETKALVDLTESIQLRLQDKKALIVLDNVEPDLQIAEVVAPLREAGVTVLLTARHTLPSDAVGADASRQLDLIAPEEALDLFLSMLGEERAKALAVGELAAVRRIVDELGRHTLAVKLAGAYAADDNRDLETLAQELTNPEQGLALPGDDETPEQVRRSFGLSLTMLRPEAVRLFDALAAFATPECGRGALLAVGRALGQAHPEQAVHLLVARALIEAHVNEALPAAGDRERVRLHPLLRALAEGLFRQWDVKDQEAVGLALAEYYATYAETFQADFTLLVADEVNIAGALEWSHVHGRDAVLVDLACGMGEFWRQRSRSRDGKHYLPWAVDASARLLDSADNPEEKLKQRRRAALISLEYGWILWYVGQPELGERALQAARAGFHDSGDLQGEGRALAALSDVRQVQGHLDEAEEYAKQSLAIARDAGDWVGELDSLAALGSITVYRGSLQAAEGYAKQALGRAREVGDREREGAFLHQVGLIALLRGDMGGALGSMQQALEVARAVGDPVTEAGARSHLGRIALLQGQPESAEGEYRQCLMAAHDFGNLAFESFFLEGLAEVLLQRGKLDEAEECAQRGLACARAVQERQLESEQLSILGSVAFARGQLEPAAEKLQESLRVIQESGHRLEESRCLRSLGGVAEAQGDLQRAESLYRRSLSTAVDMQLGVESALTRLALGELLGKQKGREDACVLLAEAAKGFSDMGMPDATRASEAQHRLGCE